MPNTSQIAFSVRQLPTQQETENHKERLEKALAKITSKTRQDSLSMRIWDGIMMCSVSMSFIRWSLAIIDEHTDVLYSAQFTSGLGIILSAFYIIDLYVRMKLLHPRDRSQYSFWFHTYNMVTAMPWDIISFAAPWPNVVQAVGSIQATRIAMIPYLFRSDSPDVVDVLYINFYYTLLPKIKIIIFTGLCLHTLTILHLLSIDEHEESYRSSMLWVWTLITSAPLNVTTSSDAETTLAGFLMLLSMMVQGYFVSTVSTLLLGFNMQEQSRTHMLITLEMLRYYKVPRELQEEVLSFQYHVLQDSSMQTQFAPELERLPPTMLMEIDLYVKVGVLDKVSFFDDAPKECKRKMAMVMNQVMVDPMSAIITAGDVGSSMFFMLHGLADVTLPNGLIVATIRRGDFFGEMALVNADARRTATVCALTFCDILELTKTDFDNAIHEFPEFFDVINARRFDALHDSMRSSATSEDVELKHVGAPLGASRGDMRRNTTFSNLAMPTLFFPESERETTSNSHLVASNVFRRASSWGKKAKSRMSVCEKPDSDGSHSASLEKSFPMINPTEAPTSGVELVLNVCDTPLTTARPPYLERESGTPPSPGSLSPRQLHSRSRVPSHTDSPKLATIYTANTTTTNFDLQRTNSNSHSGDDAPLTKRMMETMLVQLRNDLEVWLEKKYGDVRNKAIDHLPTTPTITDMNVDGGGGE